MTQCQCGEATEVACNQQAETYVWFMPEWLRSGHENAGYASIGELSNPKAAGALRLGVSKLCAYELHEDWTEEDEVDEVECPVCNGPYSIELGCDCNGGPNNDY